MKGEWEKVDCALPQDKIVVIPRIRPTALGDVNITVVASHDETEKHCPNELKVEKR